MNGKFVIPDGEHIVAVGNAFDPFDEEYKPCQHTAIERLRFEKWWIWACSNCWSIRDLDHMEAA